MNVVQIPRERGYELEPAGMHHHRCPFPMQRSGQGLRTEDAVAVLDREGEAVRVSINGQQVGRLPRGLWKAWGPYLAALEEQGCQAQVDAQVWVGSTAWGVNLFMSGRLPAEVAAEEAQRAEWKAAGLCPGCGGTVDRSTSKRLVYCEACRRPRP